MKIKEHKAGRWLGTFVLTLFLMVLALPATDACAWSFSQKDSGLDETIYPVGQGSNYEGVSNVAQFKGNDGYMWFAVNGDKYVKVYKTKGTKIVGSPIKLKKKHPIFGTIVCDKDGFFYLVTGENRQDGEYNKNAIFISKYKPDGKHMKTVGDEGDSSLAYYYGESFFTQIPFDGGNCDAAINGDLLSVNYAREMYSGHQSNSVFTINIQNMKQVYLGEEYNSHSFAQRVIPYQDSFVYVSQGDCYDRAFTISYADREQEYMKRQNTFHFWCPPNALEEYDMFTLNETFAQMGNLCGLDKGRVALVASSVRSLSDKALKEEEDIFIQIFDPRRDLTKQSAYSTQGKRSGLGGPNGDEHVKDYGVKWLTKVKKDCWIYSPQAVTISKNRVAILYAYYKDYNYKGIYMIIVDSNGNIVQKATKVSAKAMLNACETPVYCKGSIYWVSNNYSGAEYDAVYINRIKL